MITQRIDYFGISRNLFLVVIEVVNKLMTSNFVHVSVNEKFNQYSKKLSNTVQLAYLWIMRIEEIFVTYNNLHSDVI